MIPKIIHQTWKNENIPDEWIFHTNTWKWNHPDWEYKLWTDQSVLDFITELYPQYLDKYLKFPFNIQRADFLRYLVVYHFGGVYADIDYECLRPFDDLCEKYNFIISYEPDGNKGSQPKWPFICNALFGSIRHHQYLFDTLESINLDEYVAEIHQGVLISTGPLKMMEVFENNHYTDFQILPSNVLCPISNNFALIETLQSRNELANEYKSILLNQGSYAIHYWSNSWVGRGLAGELINEHPQEIEGFIFHHGIDSYGNDAFNGGRDIPKLAKKCLESPEIVAFNTDGFAKFSISDFSKCVPIKNAEWNEGLYIKKEIS